MKWRLSSLFDINNYWFDTDLLNDKDSTIDSGMDEFENNFC